MLKLSIAELEQAIKLIRKTSHDYHVTVLAEPSQVRITFQSVDNEVCNITIYDEDTKTQARYTASVSLAHEASRRKV